MYIQGGYKTVSPIQLANCFAAQQSGAIRYRAVRVYFACLALIAAREAAARDAARKGRRTSKQARYGMNELCRLTGLTERVVRRELRCLSLSNLLDWKTSSIIVNLQPILGSEPLLATLVGKRSPRRPIPFPRPMLRLIAGTKSAAFGKTLIAHVLRGLSLKRQGGEIRAAGTVKASWIAEVFDLSLRSVKSARKQLIDLGFISRDTGSFQKKLNRDGAYFRVNLVWREGKGEGLKIAPRAVKSGPDFAPPYKDMKTSYESKNQKTQGVALRPAGLCKANREPKIQNITGADLKSYPRLKSLFAQAVKAGWLAGSEANFLNWIAAAVRANSIKARDPVRVFVAIVKRQDWKLITQAQENRAWEAIRHYRAKEENVPRNPENE